MKTNLMSLPSRRRLRPSLGCRAPSAAWRPHASAARSPAARASSDRDRETPAPGRRRAASPTCAERSRQRRGRPRPAPPRHALLHQPDRLDLDSRLNFRRCMTASSFMKDPISVSIKLMGHPCQLNFVSPLLAQLGRRGWVELVCSAQVFQTSTCTAIARASSTSIPRYLTVLSIFVCPRSSCTARRFPVRR